MDSCWNLMTVEDVQKFFDDPDFGSLFDILWMINREVLCALWPDEMLSVPTDLLAGRRAELDVEIQGDSIFLDMAERRALPASTGKTINFFQYGGPDPTNKVLACGPTAGRLTVNEDGVGSNPTEPAS